MIASCGFLEAELCQCSKEEGVTMADSVETLRVDLRTRAKNLGAKEKARRKECKVRFSLVEKNEAFQKNYMMVDVKNFASRNGTSKNVGSKCSGDGSHRIFLRRQMAAAAVVKKNATSLSLCMETFGLEVEEDLSTLATQTWAEGAWTGEWPVEQKEAWLNQILAVQMWRQVRGPAGAVMCETRDLGIKWPHWHTLIFEGDRRIDMRSVCPKDVKKMLLQQARSLYWKKWVAKHECTELMEGMWLERKKTNEEWTEKHRNVARKLILEGGRVQRRPLDIGGSDESKCQACRKEEGTEKAQ